MHQVEETIVFNKADVTITCVYYPRVKGSLRYMVYLTIGHTIITSNPMMTLLNAQFELSEISEKFPVQVEYLYKTQSGLKLCEGGLTSATDIDKVYKDFVA